MKRFLGIIGCILIILGLFSILMCDDFDLMQQRMWYSSDRGSSTYYFLGSLSDFCEEAGWPLMIVGGILFIVSFIIKHSGEDNIGAFETASIDIQEKVKTSDISSNADEIKKYKELLDIGAITQEEFDAKKKELLGL